MSSFDKCVQKVLANKPTTYKEAKRLLDALGYALNTEGSHHGFRKNRRHSMKMATKKNNLTKKWSCYLLLPWTYRIEQEIDAETRHLLYVISVEELPGVATHGRTMTTACRRIKEALALAFEMYEANEEDIPTPSAAGYISYQTTPSLRRWIAQEARRSNLSLSQVINQHLQEAQKKST